MHIDGQTCKDVKNKIDIVVNDAERKLSHIFNNSIDKRLAVEMA